MQWLLLILLVPYIAILLKIFIHLRKLKQFNPSRTPEIRSSIIIACHNESENIGNILTDIANQDYPGELFEVIVTDDNSTDNTFEAARDFRNIKNLKVIKNSDAGKKRAIAAGVNAARGELIITTDADCRMREKWLSTVVSFYNEYKPDLMICPVILESGQGFLGKFQELEFLGLQGITAGSAAGGMSTMCNGANLAFTKESFSRHSDNLHYEILSGDDIFLLHSIKKEKGSKIAWLESREAIVTTTQPKRLLKFLDQRVRWISKGKAYTDRFTVLLSYATFAAILSQAISMVAWVFDPSLLLMFPVIAGLKSVPDFLILFNSAVRYGKRRLLGWFLPSLLIYPFYVLAVLLRFRSTIRNRSV